MRASSCMPSLPRTLSMQTPVVPLSALTFTVSRVASAIRSQRAARAAANSSRSSCRPVIVEEPIGQLPFAGRRALDDLLRGEIEEDAVDRAERQRQLLRNRPHAERPPPREQVDHLHRSPDTRHAPVSSPHAWLERTALTP